MKSMTGYAYCENSGNGITVSAEIKGYNSRFLDLNIFLPPWLSALEPEIREYMTSRFNRGKVEVGVRLKEQNNGAIISINTETARAYYRAVEELSVNLGLSEKPDLRLILGMEGVIETEKNRDLDKYREFILPVLVSAADRFEAERGREGEHTEKDILSHLAVLEDSVKIIEARVPELEAAIKENLRSRFAEVLGDKVDENRVLAETAVLLMKYTVSEELSRLSAHLAAFGNEVEHNPAPGKKLDFLCQEINREVNTIGSKTTILEVSKTVVEMKNALENIREQLRNVE